MKNRGHKFEGEQGGVYVWLQKEEKEGENIVIT